MGISIEDKIHHLQTLKAVWEIELRHSSNTTEKEINQGIVDSLDSAIETMRKYQRIGGIYYSWNTDKHAYYALKEIGEVLENGIDD